MSYPHTHDMSCYCYCYCFCCWCYYYYCGCSFCCKETHCIFNQSINQSALRILLRYAHESVHCTATIVSPCLICANTHHHHHVLSKSSHNLSFNTTLVVPSCNPEHSAFAPAFIPAVYYKPVWLISISIYSPANDLYCKK
jgi:hypothetical protein